MARILFLGQSHARNLDSFINQRPKFKNFTIDRARIELFGIGGLKISDLIRLSTRGRLCFEFIERFAPDILVLMIGDNDVCDTGNFSVLYKRMLDVIRNRFPYIRKVVISQLLPRHGNSVDVYNQKARNFNTQLLSMANQDKEFLLMKFVNFHFPGDDTLRFEAMKKYYARDGVHLNPSGYYRLYSEIRHIATRFANKRQLLS